MHVIIQKVGVQGVKNQALGGLHLRKAMVLSPLRSLTKVCEDGWPEMGNKIVGNTPAGYSIDNISKYVII